MTYVIKLPQLAWYRPRELKLRIPDGWQVEVCNMAGYNRPAMNDDQIRSSITRLIGSPPLRTLARGKNEVVIIFDDITRVTKVYQIVPFVLEELAAAGIPDKKIRFIAAVGCHAAMNRIDFAKKLGEATLARFPVYNHNPFDNCTYVGTTSYGTKVSINAEVMKCDLKIAIGSITPHRSVVFGGGGKMIIPGVSSAETIRSNHALLHKVQNADSSKYETNVMRLDMEESASLVGLEVNIECLVNSWGETVAIFAGAFVPSHAAGIQQAKAHYLTPKANKKDIVIANSFAKASEFATGTAVAFPSISKKGGDVVLIANAPQGQVVHYLGSAWGRTTSGGPIKPAVPQNINRLIIYTEYPDIAGLSWFQESDKICQMNHWNDVSRSLKEDYGSNATVAVYPNADIQCFG
jgi:nickel-dependent lactate racemase